MKRYLVHLIRLLSCTATGFLLAGVCACNLGSPAQNQAASSRTPAKSVAAPPESTGGNDPGIDLECAADRIQKAPAPFHWSFKKVVPPTTNADWEAEITAQTIAGTYSDNSGTRAIHAVRSDATAWDTAVLVLSGALPASTFALVDHSSAMVRSGTEDIDGETTIKYRIDTSRDTPTDASLIQTILGAKGFVKGAAWVTPQGCPVKFVLDVEQHNRDGTVEKEHYEAAATRR